MLTVSTALPPWAGQSGLASSSWTTSVQNASCSLQTPQLHSVEYHAAKTHRNVWLPPATSASGARQSFDAAARMGSWSQYGKLVAWPVNKPRQPSSRPPSAWLPGIRSRRPGETWVPEKEVAGLLHCLHAIWHGHVRGLYVCP